MSKSKYLNLSFVSTAVQCKVTESWCGLIVILMYKLFFYMSFLYAEVSFLYATVMCLKTDLLSILYMLHRSTKIYKEAQ